VRRARKTWFALIAGGAGWAVSITDGAARAAPFLTPPPAGGPSATAPSPPTDQTQPQTPPAPYAAPQPGSPTAPAYPPPSYPYTYPPPPPTYPAYPPSYPYRGRVRSWDPTGPGRPWDPEVEERRRAAIHNHDGFYLNLGLGLVFARNTISDAAAPAEASGAGLGFTGALGGAIARNLILCVRVQASRAETHFKDAVRGYDEERAVAETSFLGGGLVYYLEDTNVFLAGVIGLSSFEVSGEYGNPLTDTRARLGGAVDFGKEWWVMSNWGIGLVARGSWGTAKDPSHGSAAWTNLGLALLFSATYN
jgi:hypothetical protein